MTLRPTSVWMVDSSFDLIFRRIDQQFLASTCHFSPPVRWHRPVAAQQGKKALGRAKQSGPSRRPDCRPHTFQRVTQKKKLLINSNVDFPYACAQSGTY